MASQALRDFKISIGAAESLIEKEREFTDPPKKKDVRIVQGLRGGAIVLMVAAFENFLKEMVEEQLQVFTTLPVKYNPKKISKDMLAHNYHSILSNHLKQASSGSPTSELRIEYFVQASHKIVGGVVEVGNFSSLAKQNPDADR